MSLEQRVCEIVESVLGESISIESSQDTVENWDSANVINMLIAFESEFGGVTFSTDEAAELRSVRQIVQALREKGVK